MHNAIKNKIVATIAVIIVSLYIIGQYPKELYWAICYQLEHNSDMSFNGKINSVMKGIQVYSTLKLSRHENNLNIWIDLWGYIQKKLGIIYFPGIDENMVYLNNGHLIFLAETSAQIDKTPSEITSEAYCEKYKEIYRYFSDKNIEILYIVFPLHLHQKTVLPYGLKDDINQISTDRIIRLKEHDIPVIDTRELFKNSPDVHYKLFYKGDHHWVPEYAYRVYIYISEELEKQHSPMVKYFDRSGMTWSDYYIENRLPPFHDHLGSAMRRVGKLYLPERDITSYMIPHKKTNFTFLVPSMNIDKTGSVNDTFLDFFIDVPIEIIINNRVNNKNKIFVFHNSFIHSFAPFLAANNHCLYMIDLRHFHGNVIDLIEQEKPDAIVFAYNRWFPFSNIELLEKQIQEKQKLNKAKKND